MKKIALITGATSGIGMECAHKLASLEYNIIITGRRKERLVSLSELLQSTYNIDVLTLNFDVRNFEETNTQLNSIPKNWQTLSLLINNAGLAAGLDKFQNAQWNDWEQMIDTNVKGLLNVTRIIVPLMIKQKSGLIINISSIAGIDSYGGGSVYCGSKHAVNAISKSMRIDLLEHNIKVSTISPGMVETEFSDVRFKGDKEKAQSVYKGLTPLNAKDIAETVEFIATRPSHVNINDILIMPTRQADAFNTYRE